jgi:hypothetical protein
MMNGEDRPSPRKNGINTAGILALIAVFSIAVLSIVWLAGHTKSGGKFDIHTIPIKSSASAEQPKTVPPPRSEEPLAVISENENEQEQKREYNTGSEEPYSPENKPVSEQQKKSKYEPSEKNEISIPGTTPSSGTLIPDKNTATRKPEKNNQPKPAATKNTTVNVQRVGTESETEVPISSTQLQNPGTASIPNPVEKVNSKSLGGKSIPWYSVRVGYTDSKMRADILRDVLREQGFITAETITTEQGTYFISLGNFTYRYQAEQVAEGIKEKTSLIPQVFEKTVAK